MSLISLDGQILSDTKQKECDVESVQLTPQLKLHGQYLVANVLYPVPTIASVQVRGYKVLVTDGPFAETREQLGG
jgi:hypothetical protein